jgi:hypothetical protein
MIVRTYCAICKVWHEQNKRYLAPIPVPDDEKRLTPAAFRDILICLDKAARQ